MASSSAGEPPRTTMAVVRPISSRASTDCFARSSVAKPIAAWMTTAMTTATASTTSPAIAAAAPAAPRT